VTITTLPAASWAGNWVCVGAAVVLLPSFPVVVTPALLRFVVVTLGGVLPVVVAPEEVSEEVSEVEFDDAGFGQL